MHFAVKQPRYNRKKEFSTRRKGLCNYPILLANTDLRGNEEKHAQLQLCCSCSKGKCMLSLQIPLVDYIDKNDSTFSIIVFFFRMEGVCNWFSLSVSLFVISLASTVFSPSFFQFCVTADVDNNSSCFNFIQNQIKATPNGLDQKQTKTLLPTSFYRLSSDFTTIY